MSRYDRAFCSGKRWAQLEAAAAGRLDPGPPEVEEPPAPVLCYLCDPRRCLFCRHPNQHTRTRSGRPARALALMAKAAAALEQSAHPYDWRTRRPRGRKFRPVPVFRRS